MLTGNNPRFPRTKTVPSTTKLTYRLAAPQRNRGRPEHTLKAFTHQHKQHQRRSPRTPGNPLGAKVTVVVMESTSDYWRPFYYLLEDDFEVMLVNARDVRSAEPPSRT